MRDNGNQQKKVSRAESFESVPQAEVPKGRDGKHKQIVSRILNDVKKLVPGSALKIPLSQLPDSKENIRSALSRAAHQKQLPIATSSNSEFLYVWKTDGGDGWHHDGGDGWKHNGGDGWKKFGGANE